MATMRAEQIVDRVRSLCVGEPFLLVEAPRWESFAEVPSQQVDGVFRIPPPSSQRVVGGFGYIEDRTDSMQIWVARKITDLASTRRALLLDVTSLTSAIMRDAYQVSGEYTVPDEGRGHAVVVTPGQEYATLRVTVPINYESQL